MFPESDRRDAAYKRERCIAMERYEYNTVIVGTGAAGWNAADSLVNLGQTDICIVTEHKNAGTSRNTGSDKQTYYKLTLSGEEGDSVGEMAKTLFAGGCVDGDLALCEAALSAKCFYKLAELGVPFPKNRYGEYIGYKTDHDPRRRATSAGPYTSKMMTECLEREVLRKGVKLFDGYQVVRILVKEEQMYGILCLNLNTMRQGKAEFAVFFCKNLIYAVGGPAGIYADSVYPKGHYGGTGIALEAGVNGKNLTEWQYGLASVNPRWNVSGSYMQVLPRVYSVDPDGGDEREFLAEAFDTEGEMLSNLFLKGYQWPFDVKKAVSGSSRIDLLVYIETLNGRKVYLDYRENPLKQKELHFDSLNIEAREYLEQAGACFGTPFERLCHMNKPAVEFYKSRGVDLEHEPLEIALCAQHNNGGLAVDCWWQTNIQGLFAAGEVSATHGITRPGGSALNAGQVGSFRAAEYIAAKCDGRRTEQISLDEMEAMFSEEINEIYELARKAQDEDETGKTEAGELWDMASRRMSNVAAAVRDPQALKETMTLLADEISGFSNIVYVKKVSDLWKVFRLRDVLICQYACVGAMEDYVKSGGNSRGSALYSDEDGEKPMKEMPEFLRFILDSGELSTKVQEVSYDKKTGICRYRWRPVREIPTEDDFFENVWRRYRENRNIE